MMVQYDVKRVTKGAENFMVSFDFAKTPITQREFNDHRAQVIEDISLIRDCMDGVISFVDNGFPKVRGRVKGADFPVVLFYKGDINLLTSQYKTIAVIGLLEPTEQIQKVEERVVEMLVNKGAVIVSGLANGCDSIAHIQTLESNGKTIAILPSTLDYILPMRNEILADEIVRNGGLLITEYYKQFSSKKELSGRYIERDRLQALFSDCVVLSASYSKEDKGDSGSIHAMEAAKKYGIEVMAKLQISTTHEIATVRSLPLVSNVFKKIKFI